MFNKSLLLFSLLISLNVNAIELSELQGKVSNNKNIVDPSFKIDKSQPMIGELNVIRNKFNLPDLNENDSLNAASINHAYYLSNKNYVSHDQDRRDPKFTGEKPIDRAKYTGYNKEGYYTKVGEVVAMYEGYQDNTDLDNFLVAIYHRLSILEPSFTDYGEVKITDGNKSISEMKLGATSPDNKIRYIYYPIHGQNQIPIVFYPDQEVPNPMPAFKKVGYPVSFQITSGNILNIKDFSLKDINGNIVKGKMLNSLTDPHVLGSQFAFIPYDPLKNSTNYTASINGEINNNPFTHSWSFRTEDLKNPIINIDKEQYYPSEKIHIFYKNIPDTNVKIELESPKSKNLLVKINQDKNNWGKVELTALKGCRNATGCKTVFTLALNNGQKYKKSFLVMP